jgi:hypothetical protein
MAANQSIPDDEMAAFERKREFAKFADAMDDWLSIGKDAAQFMTDLDALAQVISSPEFDELGRAKLSGTPRQRATGKAAMVLPFGPLRRIARRLGPVPLRYVLSVGSPIWQSAFRLVLRRRFDSEFASSNRHKAYAERSRLIEFGSLVLRLEHEHRCLRSEARSRAAERLKIERSDRSLERWFAEFVALSESIGYVPSPLEWAGSLPRFSLADLDPKGSAKRQK